MRTENTKRWMIWTIVILAAMNVAMIVTVLYNRRQVAEVLNVQQNRENEFVNSSSRFSGRYFRDQLSLSRDQMSEFSRFNPEFRQQVREINIRLAELRQQMLNELVRLDQQLTEHQYMYGGPILKALVAIDRILRRSYRSLRAALR